jgi:filamentous hemagglutinin family protein
MTASARTLRRLLLASASLATIGFAGTAEAQNFGARRNVMDPAAQSAQAAQSAVQRNAAAQAAAERTRASLDRASQIRAQMDAAQRAAREAARTVQTTIPNGLGAGGLQVAADVDIDPSLWIGANGPTQSTDGDRTLVTVEQTQQKAILTWDSFNVGRETTLRFDQSAGRDTDGSNGWIALNRVTDASADPSRILGNIEAEGSVYLINRNGIIFGGASQVNVHTLIASSLSLFSDNVATSNNTFLTQGINSPLVTNQFILGGNITFANNAAFEQWNPPGDISIEAGAQITTGSTGLSIIGAPNVTNAGTIMARDGQSILFAGYGLRLFPNQETSSALAGFQAFRPVSQGRVSVPGSSVGRDLSRGALHNTGIIGSTRGNISLLGYDVHQEGIVQATTSVSRPGSLYIAAQDPYGPIGSTAAAPSGGVLTFAPNSLTTILPERDGETTTTGDSADLVFRAPVAVIAGTQVTFQNDAFVYAPGAALDLLGWAEQRPLAGESAMLTQRIEIQGGATIDVSGLAGVELPMSANLVEIPRVGQNELADSPLQRDGFLYRRPVLVDGRLQGVRDDGLEWVGSPLLNAAGYVENQPRTVDQMLMNGGSITVIGREFVTREGSRLNVDGGFAHYLGGFLPTTRLIGADGRVYDIGDADPNMTYVGIAGEYTVDHARWGVTETFMNRIGSRLRYESDYFDGGNAGSINLMMTGPTWLGGELSANAVSGRYQIASGHLAQGGTFTFGLDSTAVIPAFDGSISSSLTGRNVIVVEGDGAAPADFDIGDPATSLPDAELTPDDRGNPLFWTALSADMLNAGGFAKLDIGNDGRWTVIDEGASLTVQDGGSITLTGARVDVGADLIAQSGDLSIRATGSWNSGTDISTPQIPEYIPRDIESGYSLRGDIVVADGVKLDVSGRFVNDAFLPEEQLRGRANVDGGSISLVTLQTVPNHFPTGGLNGINLDWTGSILLGEGTVLDASGGGYVNPNGTLAMQSGLPLGRGGDIALKTYVRDPNWDAFGSGAPMQFVAQYPAANDMVGRILMDGAELRGFSMSGGGTLSLRALDIRIGGEPDLSDPRILNLSADFFSAQGFGAYDLSAEFDATIVAGSTVQVSQRNLIPDVAALLTAPSDAELYSGAYGQIGTLDPYYRPAADFSLRGGDYVGRFTSGNPQPNRPGATGTTLLDSGASLLLDPGADVRLASRGQVTVFGSIVAPGGTILLSGDTTLNGLGEAPRSGSSDFPRNYTSRSKSVWLGADSLLDVSGISLIDPLAASVSTADGPRTPRTGRILDGGTVILTNDTGYVVVEDGARIDISGVADRFDIVMPGATNPILSRQDVWSNGGVLTIAAGSGGFFDGSIEAHGGSVLAEGGMLTLRPIDTTTSATGTGGILFHQEESLIPQDLTPGDSVEPNRSTASGILHFTTDWLTNSGISTLVAGTDASREGNLNPLRIGFAGDVSLSLDRAIMLNASSYVALTDTAIDLNITGEGGSIQLDAPYVSLTGLRNVNFQNLSTNLAVPNGGSLTITAEHIDIGGRFSLNNFANANFESSGDIRFYTPANYAYAASGSTFTQSVGQLLTAGDLTFKAAQIYPATGNAFAVVALGPLSTGSRAETTITILPNGEAATPLSAGGALLLDATHVDQQGTLRAPAGYIALGVSDPNDANTKTLFGGLPLVGTQSVRFGDGSLTSVSLDGLLVPFGVTVDQLDLRDTSNPFNVSPTNLDAPPEKQIVVSAADVALGEGATIDLTGGGDLYAMEWVAGTGGSRDVLSRTNTRYSGNNSTEVPLYPDGRSVYAVVPGFASGIAPYDPALDTGDVVVGQQIYLSGGDGIPAGVYTLLPAKYATLPGAYRVVQDIGAIDAIPGSATLPDGTQRISGYFTDGLTGSRDARTTAFLVQSADVWRQYSEYVLTGASDYFSDLAERNGTATRRLPIDAGRLSLAATAGLSFGATLKTGAAEGGTAAQVDIASQRIQITGGDAPALDGYLQLAATDLSALGAGSLLIGGSRTQNANGITITAQATNVVVSNDESTALVGPEILLVSNGNAPSDGVAGVRLDDGSVIRAEGDIPASSSVNITIGRNADTAAGITAVSGDGALLRVSNGAPVLVLRNNVSGDPVLGVLDIAAGATIDGGKSLSLDATGDTRLDPAATLAAKAIDANSSSVSFVSDAAAGTGLTGLVVGPETLAQLGQAETVTFRSRGAMTFVGDIPIDLGDAELALSAGSFVGTGEDVRLSAGTLTLSNDLGAVAPAATNDGGVLILEAARLQFGVGDKSLTGFSSVNANASEAIVGTARGSFDFGAAPVTLTAPAIVAGNVADTTLTTTGAMHLVRSEGDGPADLPVGGTLTLVGGTIESDARIVARAGTINLRATQGDLLLNEGSIADVSGVAKDFFDVTHYAPAGTVSLTADQGDVRLLAGATLDFSGADDGGDAGTLRVAAADGVAVLDGTIDGSATEGFAGGAFSLETGEAVSLDGLAERLAATGINRAIAVRSLAGNLELTAGHELRAQDVTLVADGGPGGRDSAEGRVIVAGTIDASGEKGGTITLSGRSGVDIQGRLLATGSSDEERGGSVTLATIGQHDGTYNADYGYQNVTAAGSGVISIGPNAVIDVSGGEAGGLSGGTLAIRAPLLSDGEVNVAIANGARIEGARDVGLEAYAVWSTTDTTTGQQHFDGIIDPAGWFSSQGVRVAGTWTDRNGNAVANGNPERDYFAPTTPNADHLGFYQMTLANFVQDPGFAFEGRFAGIANFHARPGIELSNPSPDINGGNISVLSNWNLGAGASLTELTYRYNDEAPILTLRADDNIEMEASITDGFWFGSEQLSPLPIKIRTDATAAFTANGLSDPLVDGAEFSIVEPGTFTEGTPEEQSLYYEMYVAFTQLFSAEEARYGRNNVRLTVVAQAANFGGFVPGTGPDPANPAPQIPTSLEDYAAYLDAYRAYATVAVQSWTGVNFIQPVPYIEAPVPPPLRLSASSSAPPKSGNSAAPFASIYDQLPIHSATLIGGGASYRFVAGTDRTSSNPLATSSARDGDIVIAGRSVFTPQNLSTRDVLLPTVLRTGTGSIELVAANDIRLDDARAPGVIYSAGRPIAGSAGSTTTTLSQGIGGNPAVTFALIKTGAVNPEAAGDVRLTAGRDVIGNRQVVDVDGRVTGRVGTYVGQYWWQWMQVGNTSDASTINFGSFGQGVVSIGGDISVTAGRDIRELSVSLPTTWTLTPDPDGIRQLTVYGGGDLIVSAGRDVLGGDFFVSKGSGELDAGGLVGSAFNLNTGVSAVFGTAPVSTPVATIFALQDADWQISGATGVEIGGIYNPSYVRGITGLFTAADSQAYSTDSSLSVMSTSGDVALGTVSLPGALFSYGASQSPLVGVNNVGRIVFDDVLPASISATAFDGDLSVEAGGALFPSASGDLTLLAADSLRLFSRRAVDASGSNQLRMLDVDAALYLPSPSLRLGQGINLSGSQSLLGISLTRYNWLNLHRNDTNPVRLYAVQGDIIGGFASTLGTTLNPLTVSSAKPALVQAGRDIIDFDFRGTNYHDSDITRITAGRDLYYTRPNASDGNALGARSNPATRIEIAGPGVLDIQAGRDLGPLASEPRANTGIVSTGNRDNAGLPYEGADIRIRFGTGPGIATDAFADAYLNPANPNPDVPDFSGDLIAYVQTYLADHPDDAGQPGAGLTAEAAWEAFQTLPAYRRQLLVEQVFLKVLNQVGVDYRDIESPYFEQYARGYQAINTLFPAELGYTANALDGGPAGATDPVITGNLDMRGSTIQTQQGGDINIIAPGGRLIVGSSSAPPVIVDGQGRVIVGPSQQGILTLRQGNIGIFADGSTLLAQSRIFTQQGGAILMWSSNGDINAGRGAKTSSEIPPVRYECDLDRYCRVNASGQVTGAGIATLQTIPDAPAGDAVLVAPRGTVDAGDAGIRISGDLIVAAQFVANADNIQVQGEAIGLPQIVQVNTGALTSASSASAAVATQAADLAERSRPTPVRDIPAIVNVRFVGFGE